MYKYKYIPASISAMAKKGTDPKKQFIDLFQETLNQQFYNSSDWWTIQEETSIGSKEYTNIDVRMTHVINAETGLKLGDDWKTLLFKDIDHNIELGKQYVFDDNTWVTINTEFIKNLTGTCTIRRCNNTLRWIDEPTGAYYEEPCCIEYMVKESRDYATQGSPFMTPGGFLHIEMQFNENTNKIKQNQRFLFGNTEHWTCYKVIGTGLNDFRNIKTHDNASAKILSVDLIANFVNEELDDVINGIADVNTNVYTIELNRTVAEGYPGDVIQLLANVTYNGNSATRTIVWTSSDVNVATVTSNGVITLNAIGTCTITANIQDNPSYDTCSIVVSNTPTINTDVVITPDKNYILEGSQETYTVYLYQNNIKQTDTFTITCSGSSVPSTSYTFTQSSGNSFAISNLLRDVNSYLTINCTSGSTIKSSRYFLRGAW